ncbi:VOC family protein [Conexibacter arvalis]|uniref:Catechol 2,3-dioxygenase-like lactoylglutathione lyase family enzyme n=1 Tax=Conexibacter arvalis TaxID=912552 RepID=A0A840IC80_9ACTN|nr:VOC family protein [Conexibacter arvalis]MBB4661823.1 catechol 2,3-dioxygenase-like lactoylglutathione lyase family enzyme [Conexibacter arvalis]
MSGVGSASTFSAARLGRLAGVTVTVPDPAATARFLTEGIGFPLAETVGDAIAIRCAGDYGPHGQTAITLLEGEALALRAITWEVADDYDLGALADRLAARGTETRETAAGGLAFADPAGNPLALERTATVTVPTPPHGPVGPRRLGHLNVKSPAPPETAAFYREALGMLLSEQIGDGLWFLRIGAEHHNLGLRPGARGELHHLGLEVNGWHAYEPILDRLAAQELKVEYGPGRHGPGRNIFTYVCDPSSGLRVELFADMAQIPDETTYVPPRWEAGDRMTKTINRWGPTPPESFLA